MKRYQFTVTLVIDVTGDDDLTQEEAEEQAKEVALSGQGGTASVYDTDFVSEEDC